MWMKVPICKTFFEYAKTKEEKLFSKNILILYDLFKKAKSKELFPLDNPLYFKRSMEQKDIQSNLEKVKFYIQVYSIYHYPLLFFDIIHKQNSQNNLHFTDFWDYSFQLENIMDSDIFNSFMEKFTSFYQGNMYEEFKQKLENILQTNSILDIYIDTNGGCRCI